MESVDEHLLSHGIKPTAVRQLVWKKVSRLTETFTLGDMEDMMPDMDRSSIFRALRLFADNHLLHIIDDGSGSQKYCVCRCENGKHINHIHFTCVRCGKTYCLEDYQIPVVQIPEGFVMEEAEYVVKGVCASCGAKGM